MDIGSSFSFVFNDSDWVKKVAIGALLVLGGLLTFGILLIPVAGWAIAITRRVIRREIEVLPDWSNFGEYFIDGLKLIVIGIVWALPVILANLCSTGVTLAGPELFASGDDAEILIAIVTGCVGLFALLYGIVLGILTPAAWGLLADTGELGTAINPANAFRLVRANIGGYLIAWLLGSIAASILAGVGLLICAIGLLPAVIYGQAIIGNLYGQAYLQAQAQTGVAPA